MNYTGNFILLVGPSGAGKTYIEKRFIKKHRSLKRLVSFTTRKQRPGEIDGIDYHFIDKKDVKDLNILQKMEIYGNYYGTCVEHLQEGFDHILVVGVDGPEQFETIFGKDRVLTIFIYASWYKRLFRLVKRDGIKKGLKRFVSDIGRFKDFNKSDTIIWRN